MNEHHQPFEEIRHYGTEGQEFWSARELAPLLDYRDWRNFQKVLARATQACEASNQAASDHFVETTKMVVLGSGAQRELEDVHLSRYACYLVVQNGDPAKPVIAAGQTYFAIQTRGNSRKGRHRKIHNIGKCCHCAGCSRKKDACRRT